ncbi:MAG: class I adenylate-forming enzyme family protein [Pseudodonghicola sp.]
MIWVNTPVVIEGYDGQDPFGPDVLDARGFLKTGDMGYLDADGFLYITDREKDMIVSGGVNIYPPEIEAALCRFPTVVEAAVIGIPHDDFGEQVMAFVQLKPGSDTSVDDISEFLVEQLASYKRPRRIEIVGELPHGVSGKILKRELREPFWKGRTRKV